MVGVVSVFFTILTFVLMLFKRNEYYMKTIIIQKIISGSVAIIG